MTADSAGRLIIGSAESAYVYTPESGELIKKLDWSSYDFTGITAGMILPYEENGLLAISRNYATVPMSVNATAFCEATAEEASNTQEKIIITIGTLDTLPAGLKTEIVNFNKNNPDVKLETKNYSEDSNLLYTELIAGTAPDLLLLPSDKLAQFSRKGALEDLNPYFSQDESLNRADFMENILTAFETDGHLYGIPLSFTVSTVVGKTSELGTMTSWNIDELISFAQGFPKDVGVFDNCSKSGVFSLLKRAYIPQLVDMTNVENPLNRDLLVKIMEFSNQYISDSQYTYDENLTGKVAQNNVKIMDTTVFMAHDYYARCGFFEEPITYIGYPTDLGNGNLIRSPYTFTIRSGCANKEIAWIQPLLFHRNLIRLLKKRLLCILMELLH